MSRQSQKLIYIAATPFSGSTLLTLLMGFHPHIATVGEMTGVLPSMNINTYYCSCGMLINHCPFWLEVTHRMQNQGFAFNVANFHTGFILGRNRITQILKSRSFHNLFLDTIRDKIIPFYPGYVQELKELQVRNWSFIQSVLEVTKKQIFLDASKDPIRMRFLAEIPSLDVKVIHLVRDARGQVNSFRKNVKNSVLEGAKAWRRTNMDIERFIKTSNISDSVLVRYEDVCSNSKETLAKIFSFCDIHLDTELVDFHLVKQHVIGNRMRLQSLSQIHLDESWRTEITTQQIAQIAHIAGSLNSKYGY